MSKIKYPESGIVKTQSTLLDSINSDVNKLTEISFDVPYTINDTVLSSFSQLTQELKKDYQNMIESFEKSDKNYELLDIEIQNKFNQIVVDPITKRDKII